MKNKIIQSNLLGNWNGMKCTMTPNQKSHDKCAIHILTYICR